MREITEAPKARLAAAMAAEILKARRSKAPWVTAVAFALPALVGGLFMIILRDPERARSMGLLGAKAQLTVGTADWPTYLQLLTQATAVGGLLVFALVFIWIFGREFSDHTSTDLLALPTARTTIVAAKLLVASAWCMLLGGGNLALGLLVGTVLRLPGWSPSLAVGGIGRLALTAALTVVLVTPFALAASIGRGYLTAVGLLFLTVFTAQIIAALGHGALFPWSVPALASGLAGPDQPAPGPAGYTLVVLVGVTGAIATATWWQRADHNR